MKTILAIAWALCFLAAPATHAKTPDGWPFVEYTEAIKLSQKSGKPMFVLFGFPTCPYCEYLNKHTFSSEMLRKRYSASYVLGYFDIRGNPADVLTLHDGKKMTRAEAIKHLKGSPVPGWTFVSSDGKEILQRKGSRTKVAAFLQFDAYVRGGDAGSMTYEQFLASRGWVEEKLE
ncbi:MAG: thioredoxin family protein [Burkholderiales bacterium]